MKEKKPLSPREQRLYQIHSSSYEGEKRQFKLRIYENAFYRLLPSYLA